MSAVEKYRRSTGLEFPVLADEDRKTESAYGFTISLRNTYQWRIIDGEGNVVGFSPDDASIAAALSNAKLELGGREFSPQVKAIADDVEWGRYPAASAALVKFKRVRDKKIKQDVAFLLGFLEKKAAVELAAAQALESGGKLYKAYRKYEGIVLRFSAGDAAKKARKAAIKLRRKREVKKELLAMKNYEIAAKFLASKKGSDRARARSMLLLIIRKFKGTKGAALSQKAYDSP